MVRKKIYHKIIFPLLLFLTVSAKSITAIASDRDFNDRIKYLAVGYSTGQIRLWDLSIPKIIASYNTNSSSILSINMNLYSNSIVASFSDGNVLKIDTKGNEKWSKYYPPGSNAIYSSLNQSKNGEYLYLVGNDPSGIILDKEGEIINYFYTNYKSSIYGLTSHISHDNDFLLTTHNNHTIKVWSIMDTSLTIMHENKQNKPRISAMSTLENGNLGSVVILADRKKRIHLYDYLSDKYIENAKVRHEPSAISFINGVNNDHSFLVGNINGNISFWTIERRKKLKILDESKKIHNGKIIGLIPLNREQGSLVITADKEAVFIIDYTNYQVKAKLYNDEKIETYDNFKIEKYF